MVLLLPRRVSFGVYAVVKTPSHIVNLHVDESLISSLPTRVDILLRCLIVLLNVEACGSRT
jgi:hypothetical protein